MPAATGVEADVPPNAEFQVVRASFMLVLQVLVVLVVEVDTSSSGVHTMKGSLALDAEKEISGTSLTESVGVTPTCQLGFGNPPFGGALQISNAN